MYVFNIGMSVYIYTHILTRRTHTHTHIHTCDISPRVIRMGYLNGTLPARLDGMDGTPSEAPQLRVAVRSRFSWQQFAQGREGGPSGAQATYMYMCQRSGRICQFLLRQWEGGLSCD